MLLAGLADRLDEAADTAILAAIGRGQPDALADRHELLAAVPADIRGQACTPVAEAQIAGFNLVVVVFGSLQ